MLLTADPDARTPREPTFSRVTRSLRISGGMHRDSATSTRSWSPLELLVADRNFGSESGVQEFEFLTRDLWEFMGALESPSTGIVRSVALPYSECARLFAIWFSISKSDLARIFLVSRPTYYAWMAGEAEPRDEGHRRKLSVIGNLARELFRDGDRPLYQRFVYDPLPGEVRSLIETLRGDSWDEDDLRRLVILAKDQTDRREDRLQVVHSESQGAQEQNLRDNLLSLGSE